MRKKGYTIVILLAVCLALSGYQMGVAEPNSLNFETSSLPELSYNASADVPASAPVIAPVQVSVQPVQGSGTITDASVGGDTLNATQKQVLTEYMDLYYQSLAGLSAKDPTALFADDAREGAQTRQSAWQVIIDVRKMQQVDLSLTAYSWQLELVEAEKDEKGDLSIMARENSVQNFTAFPGTSSESHNVYHRFVLTETNDGWKLRSHMQMDSANMMALGRAMFRGWRNDPDEGNTHEQLAEQRENVLAAHRTQLAERDRQRETYSGESAGNLSWAHDYDRAAAVAYAMEWVEARNRENWPTYDRNGGNCANFTSQCLLAGGIPMDTFGANQWKWYGDTPSTLQSATGRSGSWSGVNEFFAYVTQNTGYGMVAEPDANFWSGELGDLIQLGYEDDWRHVVIITEVIRDESGKTVDYLINSNTADQRSYPVSAYLYPQQRLIRIHGWKED